MAPSGAHMPVGVVAKKNGACTGSACTPQSCACVCYHDLQPPEAMQLFLAAGVHSSLRSAPGAVSLQVRGVSSTSRWRGCCQAALLGPHQHIRWLAQLRCGCVVGGRRSVLLSVFEYCHLSCALQLKGWCWHMVDGLCFEPAPAECASACQHAHAGMVPWRSPSHIAWAQGHGGLSILQAIWARGLVHVTDSMHRPGRSTLIARKRGQQGRHAGEGECSVRYSQLHKRGGFACPSHTAKLLVA